MTSQIIPKNQMRTKMISNLAMMTRLVLFHLSIFYCLLIIPQSKEEEPKDIFEMVRDEIQKEKEKENEPEEEEKPEENDKQVYILSFIPFIFLHLF